MDQLPGKSYQSLRRNDWSINMFDCRSLPIINQIGRHSIVIFKMMTHVLRNLRLLIHTTAVRAKLDLQHVSIVWLSCLSARELLPPPEGVR